MYGHNSTRQPLDVKRIVGYLPDNVGFYEEMTAKENLLYTADLNGIPQKEAISRIDELLSRVGLDDVADKEVGKFSRGMRQRLGIADVLIKRPRVVILDEPTLGIDPDGVKQMLEHHRQDEPGRIASHTCYPLTCSSRSSRSAIGSESSSKERWWLRAPSRSWVLRSWGATQWWWRWRHLPWTSQWWRPCEN